MTALKDASTASIGALFACKGSFKTGAVAKAEKGKAGAPIIPAEMSQDPGCWKRAGLLSQRAQINNYRAPSHAFLSLAQDTLVLVDSSGSSGSVVGQPPSFPIPLEKALQWFAGVRLQVGQIFKHKLTEVDGRFKVTPTDDIIFLLDVSRKDLDPKAIISRELLSTYVDFSKLLHLQPVQQVKYEQASKMLKQGIPMVHTTQAFLIKKDEVYKM